MNMFERFKNFLGLSNNSQETDNINKLPPSPTPPHWRGEEDGRSQPSRTIADPYNSIGYNIFSSPLEMHRYFEHEMNEMLKNFGIFAGGDSFFGNFSGRTEPFFGDNPFRHDGLESFQFPSINDFGREGHQKTDSLREQYLKPGYETVQHGQYKVDKDVDEKFNMNELDTVLRDRPAVQIQPRKFFYGQSVTTKTVRNADGSIETHKTMRDHDGNEETIITKRQGDKEYSVTTKTNKEGKQEIIENMINLEEQEKDSFLKRVQSRLTDGNTKPSPDFFPYDKFF